jgi:NAD(P)-dependent dehydrogenase (short-subunit alcohol dehydrogenase family)
MSLAFTASGVALVTGAASGIGLALAQALAARGMRLVIVDRDEAGLARVAALLPVETVCLAADLALADAPEQVFRQAFDLAGSVDLLCLNAGVAYGRPLASDNLEGDAQRLFEINFFAPLRFAQAYGRICTGADLPGRILFTCSEQSLSLPPAVKDLGFAMYGASKHALLIAVEWLREEWAGRLPIALHALLPGPVPTAMGKHVERPSDVTVNLDYITPDRCAEIALRGIELDLFYIPTHSHIAKDMLPRFEGVAGAIERLDLLGAG